MDTVQGSRQHRTFARSNGLSGGPAVPRLVAAEERHRKNLQHIRQLKLSLCATVSSAGPPPPPSSQGASLPSPSSPSLPSPALPAWEAAREGSTSVVASRTPSALPGSSQPVAAAPHQGRETPISAAVLQNSQDEVEQLVREKHRLQRQCVELASLLANTHHNSGAPSALTMTHAAIKGDSAASWSSVHDAAVAVVAQVTRCYPDVVRDWAMATCGNGAAVLPGDTKRGVRDPSTLSLATTTADITADELADFLRRLADFLPQLASMTAATELVAQADPDMLEHIRALEAEKLQDCAAVLSITEHLTSVSAQMRREAAEKDAALHALQQTVGDLLEEKQEWSRRARASEAALAERYNQYRQREKAWEREVNDLLHARDSIAAAALPPAVEANTAAVARAAELAAAAAADAAEEREAALQHQLAQRQEALDTMAVSLRNLQEAHDTLQSTHAALQASSQNFAAVQQKRIAALEGQLQPLEAELQRQSDTISATLRSVEDLTDAHRAEVAALKEAHRTTEEEREVELAELKRAKEGIEAELADVTVSVAQRTEELQDMTAARDALQRALEERKQASVGDSSSFSVTASTPLRLTRVMNISADGGGEAADESKMDSPSRLGEDEDGDNNEESTDALYRTTNVRKLQQSLKRMSRERAALKRKLEHRGAALAEMETELESAQRAVAQQEAHVQVLQADLESANATAAAAAAAVTVVASTTAAATQNAAPPQVPGSVTRITAIDWITFADLEEHEEEGSLYPTPVDLSEWLLPHRRGTERFANFVAHRLSAHDQLLVSAVGPLYHIGFNLLKAEGLLDENLYFPVIWRRVLLQLQRVVDVQLEGLAVSVADCAHRFYTLASAAGLFKDLRESSNPLTAYTLILSALSLCLGSRDGGEAEERAGEGRSQQQQRQQGSDSLSFTQLPSAVRCGNNWAKWSCCQAVLRHVCDQGDGEEDSSSSPQTPPSLGERAATPYALLMLLAQQDGVANASSPSGSDSSGFQKTEDGGSSKAGGLLGLPAAAAVAASSSSSPFPSPTPDFTLASLLSHSLLSDSLLRSHFALQMMMVQQFAQCTTTRSLGGGRQDLAEVMERGLHCDPSADCPTLVVLLLYIARYELLLEGGRVVEEGAPSLPSLMALGVRGAGEVFYAGDDTEAILLLLDTGLLPAIAMSMRLCRALEHEPHLLPTFFATRRALLKKRQEVLSHGDWAATASAQAELLLGVPIPSEGQLRDCVQQILQRVKSMPSTPGRVVQVPLVEYERLHCELLSLYQSNETYEAHLQQLLGAVESM